MWFAGIRSFWIESATDPKRGAAGAKSKDKASVSTPLLREPRSTRTVLEVQRFPESYFCTANSGEMSTTLSRSRARTSADRNEYEALSLSMPMSALRATALMLP